MAAAKIVKELKLLPALAGGVIEANGNRKIDVYGKLDITKDAMVNNNTTYIIGSCTKSITAAAIMKMLYINSAPGCKYTMENVTIGKVIKTPINDAYKNVTLKQLLCMQGGINDKNWCADVDEMPTQHCLSFWKSFINNKEDLRSQRKLLTNIVIGKGSPAPVFTYSYSNLGYVIAAHIVEVLFDTTYEKMMKNLFMGLGMVNAVLPMPSTPFNGGPHGNHAVGHTLNTKGKENISNHWLKVWYNGVLKSVAKPPPHTIVTKEEDNQIAYIVDNAIQFAPPVISAAGMLRIDIPSWLTYLKAVITHDKSFLPESRWNILLNTGMPQGKSGEWYSYGWLYFASMKDQGLLFYTGSNMAFLADIILKQHAFAICTVTNGCRGDPKDNNALLPTTMLESTLCPTYATFVQNLIKVSMKSLLGTTSSTGVPWVDPWLLNIRETFNSMQRISYDVLPFLFVLLLLVLFSKKG